MKNTIFLTAIALFLFAGINAQEVVIPQLGVQAPSFRALSTEGKINFPSDYGNKWKILISHPKDFTPVCSSEILELAYEQEKFDQLGTQIVVVSSDMIEQHNSWKAALEEISDGERSPVKIKFPLLADNEYKVSKLYGMIHSATSSKENIRGVYFIDPENKIRSIQFYPIEVGRSTSEMIRTLQALQMNYAQTNLLAPVNWQPGGDVIVRVLTDEEKAAIGTYGSPLYQKAWFLTYMKTQ